MIDYGDLLNRVSAAELFNAFGHITNGLIYVGGDDEVMYMKDWSEGQDLSGEPIERKVGYRAIQLAVAWHHMDQLPHFETTEKQLKVQDAPGFNQYMSILMGYFGERIGDPRIYYGFGPPEESSDSYNMGKVLGSTRNLSPNQDGSKTPVWQLALPEIGLMWDQERGVHSQWNVPPNILSSPLLYSCR